MNENEGLKRLRKMLWMRNEKWEWKQEIRNEDRIMN